MIWADSEDALDEGVRRAVVGGLMENRGSSVALVVVVVSGASDCLHTSVWYAAEKPIV